MRARIAGSRLPDEYKLHRRYVLGAPQQCQRQELDRRQARGIRWTSSMTMTAPAWRVARSSIASTPRSCRSSRQKASGVSRGLHTWLTGAWPAKLVDEGPAQHRLADAEIAGNGQKTLTTPQAERQRLDRAAVRPALEEIARIGGQAERPLPQAKERFIPATHPIHLSAGHVRILHGFLHGFFTSVSTGATRGSSRGNPPRRTLVRTAGAAAD